jgi:hypothetical protein
MKNNNKNLSPSYKASYLQKSDPEFGTRNPAGKDFSDNRESGKNPNLDFEKVLEAAEKPNAVKDAIAKQCGHPGKHSDNRPLANSGCGEDALDGGVCD